eukprot:1537286-Amphidinium_carterae.1
MQLSGVAAQLGPVAEGADQPVQGGVQSLQGIELGNDPAYTCNGPSHDITACRAEGGILAAAHRSELAALPHPVLALNV